MSLNLIDAGLNRISVSFEGHTKEVYEKYRVGSDFETVVKNVSDLIKLRERSGGDHPKVRVQSVLVPEVESHFEEYKDFWLSIGVDEVAYLDYKQMKDHQKGLISSWACPQLWQRMCVWWDGTLIPCNHDDQAKLDLGNVAEISIKEMWNSERVNKIREFHEQGSSHSVPGCDSCFLRDSEIRKHLEKGG